VDGLPGEKPTTVTRELESHSRKDNTNDDWTGADRQHHNIHQGKYPTMDA
jgi:hypothetical protein